jgi:MarR family transcriptional regulator for hemolysin
MQERLGRQLALTQKAVRAEFEDRLARVGGSLSTWILLDHALQEGQLSQSLLAQRMWIEGPTLVRHLDRLEGEGLVERRRDTSDRRVVLVSVTPAGKTLYKRLRTVADDMESMLTAALTDQEHRTLLRALRRLHAAVVGREETEVAHEQHAR